MRHCLRSVPVEHCTTSLSQATLLFGGIQTRPIIAAMKQLRIELHPRLFLRLASKLDRLAVSLTAAV
jgi:hypothetical protein